VGALKVNLEGVGLVGIGLVGIGPVGIGPEGIGPEGIGPEGIGPEGIGPEGIGPEGIGPEGIELEGIEEDEIEGSGGVEDAEEAEDGCPGRVFASPGALGFTWPRVLVVLQGVCAGAEEEPGGMAGRGCPVTGGTESSCGPSR